MNVYWACVDDNWLRAEAPESVSKLFFKSNRHDSTNKNLDLHYCPGFKNNLTNVYALKSIHDYSFNVKNNEVVSDMYDQEFFNKHVLIRSIEKKAFSFTTTYLFFTDEKSLEMTAYEHPFFEENSITNSCISIPGKYDIGKWFRPLEYPFYLKKNVDEFKVNYKDVMFYLRFHTNKKIHFKQFRANETIRSFSNENVASAMGLTKNISQYGGIESIYKLMKTKKMLLKEIQKNLI